MTESEVKATHTKKKKSKKRLKADLDCSTREKHVNTEGEMQELDAELDMSGPTMAEKLASLELLSDSGAKNASEKEALPSTNIPSYDSVHILLKQAIHAQDYALLVNCLSTTDEKVITKSTALLNPSDILKFLKSLLSMIELRGTVLVRALPWLRSLLSQHASSIASQESSLLILNSLYQLIESRTSTYQSALQLSKCLDCLFAELPEADENASPVLIYEDRDSDEEEEESDNTMDIDEENEGLGAVIQNSDGSDVVSD
ncbi:hypothetical protein M5K25_005079 [Dendrobium thyrsiflorum]|uniref:Small-subunit processome Utp12 domain-containing protein n=1 Tax=Dendrobium thyrsiflorum TaxID=117978 RepID=A0ABD0VHS1_DENTH